MPKLKISCIHSFSSEDSVHVASNILNYDGNKKWKCKTPGEKNATIILQLEAAAVISGIDIGNEHSAFVEVLVGRSGSSENDYEVLLSMSSFMTPMESRNSTTTNRVRMFKKEDFSQTARDEKWDRIKIVCTQPFNKNVQYGISFVTLYNLQDESDSNSQTTLGKFKLKESSEKDNIVTGSTFMKQKTGENNQPLTGAAAIREASAPSSLEKNGAPSINKTPINAPTTQRGNISNSEVKQSRNNDKLCYDDDDTAPNNKIDSVIKKHRDSQKNVPTTSKQDTKKADLNSKPGCSKRKSDTPTAVAPKKKKVVKTKPFSQLLEGVTFVMSGYQNPLRANVRQKALEMGAKYKPDWTTNCTHLICAFSNTPKYKQVYGLGKIVTKSWIEECYSKRKRLPWRRFALDCRQQRESESEEEIVDEMTVLQDDDEVDVKIIVKKKYNVSSDSDTEDEIEKIQSQNSQKMELDEKVENNKDDKENIFNADTDVETDLNTTHCSRSDSPVLPNFFVNKLFYLDKEFSEMTKYKLQRYIISFNGEIEENQDYADYIVTERQEFANDVKASNPQKVCIKPEWIWECNDLEQLVSTSPYEF